MTSRRIEELTAELAQWKQALGGDSGPQTPAEVPVFLREAERVQGHVAALEIAKLRAALATARAAREKAEAEMHWSHAHVNRLLSERDTALARVKELEAAHAELTDMCKHGIDAHKAAETALASAREKLSGLMLAIEDNYGECAEDSDDLIEVDGLIDADAIYEDLKDLRDLLTSHPAPVAAPHPSCIYAACKQGGPCMYPKPDGTACALIEAPVAEPDPLPEYEPPRMTERRAIWRCTIGINEVISLPAGCDQAMRCAAWQAFARVVGRDPVFAFSGWNKELTEEQLAVVENRMSRPPVAAPCAGCTSARTAITEALRLYAGGHEHSDALRAWLQEHP